MLRFKKCIVYCSILLGSINVYTPSTAATPQDSTSQAILFDFSERWYGPGSNAVKLRWEEEFIAFGKMAEKTPDHYIRHMLKWLDLSSGERALSELRMFYITGSGLYNMEYYRTAEDTSKYARESLREAYLFSHISRSGENIERLWETFGGLVKEIVGVYLVKGRPARSYLEGLVNAWSCITAKKGYRKKLDSCYKKLVADQPDPYSMLSYVDDLICSDIQAQFGRYDENHSTTNLQWLFTFWVRRYHEGNAEVTFEILQSFL